MKGLLSVKSAKILDKIDLLILKRRAYLTVDFRAEFDKRKDEFLADLFDLLPSILSVTTARQMSSIHLDQDQCVPWTVP